MGAYEETAVECAVMFNASSVCKVELPVPCYVISLAFPAINEY